MKRNDIIFLLISSVFITISWIVFSVMHAATTSTIEPEIEQAIQPIAPAFDIHTINTLQSRQKITPVYTIMQLTPGPTLSPTPSLSPTPAEGAAL